MLKNLLVFSSLSFILFSCSDEVALNDDSKSQITTNEQKQVQNLAKTLASEINSNEELRKEVYSKIALRFDGDYNMLLVHFSPESKIAINNCQPNKSLLKTNSDQENKKELLSELTLLNPKLQLQMPYATLWTDQMIEKFGGLIVAWYPLGVDDKEVKQIEGFDKNGTVVTINKKNAQYIPYIIINNNERVDKNLMVKYNNEKRDFSSTGINPLNFKNSDFTTNWKNRTVNDLEPQIAIEARLAKAQASEDGTPTKTWQRVNTFAVGDVVYIEGIQFDDIDDYEPRWTKGTPEIIISYCFVSQNPDGSLGTNRTPSQTIRDETPYEYDYFGSMKTNWADNNYTLNGWPEYYSYALLFSYWEADGAFWDNEKTRQLITDVIDKRDNLVEKLAWNILLASNEDDPIPGGDGTWLYFRTTDYPNIVYDRGNPAIKFKSLRLQ
ncbi:MAG: hypothetical protein LCH54_12745 [Bacteroidetes bacterium]|nr:hypothetical protein [Bacteroidota bacterium]